MSASNRCPPVSAATSMRVRTGSVTANPACWRWGGGTVARCTVIRVEVECRPRGMVMLGRDGGRSTNSHNHAADRCDTIAPSPATRTATRSMVLGLAGAEGSTKIPGASRRSRPHSTSLWTADGEMPSCLASARDRTPSWAPNHPARASSATRCITSVYLIIFHAFFLSIDARVLGRVTRTRPGAHDRRNVGTNFLRKPEEIRTNVLADLRLESRTRVLATRPAPPARRPRPPAPSRPPRPRPRPPRPRPRRPPGPSGRPP